MKYLDEVKLFSEKLNTKGSPLNNKILRMSVSRDDALSRIHNYTEVMKNYSDYKSELQKMFAGYAETPLLAMTYFDATVASLVNSFAGFLSIERALPAANALAAFVDVLGVLDGRTVLPNIGAENLANIGSYSTYGPVAAAQSPSVTIGKQIVPGSVNITLLDNSTLVSYTLTDDGLGHLIGVVTATGAPIVSVSSITYSTGIITFTIVPFTVDTAVDKMTIKYVEDVTGTSGIDAGANAGYNQFKTNLKNIEIDTYPDTLIGQTNIAAMIGMKKVTGIDLQRFMTNKLTELYTKLINKQLVSACVGIDTSTSFLIDLTKIQEKLYTYDSFVDYFIAGLVSVDTLLAENSVKGVRATAYVCGTTVIEWFKRTVNRNKWVENKASNYINDFVGTFNDVPVLRHTDLAATTGYAVHKTIDGQLAPAIRGIFLPLTNTPAIGNYLNPTQISQGVYYQEKSLGIVSELIQKFTLTDLSFT
jgi:hypothetical protein